jgi:phage tail-like protein
VIQQETRALVRVPDLIGLPLRKAQLLVANAGLAVEAVLFQESYEEKNTVLAQKPARGQMVYAGEKLTLSVSRESYARHLPAIYQRSDVTGRNFLRDLLWIVQHLFGSVEDVLDVLHTYFDPREAPEEFLPWLASWTAMVLEEDWPKEKKRKLIKKAIELYKVRGTVKGLKLFIALFTGHEPEIKENEWPFRGFRVGVTSLIGVDTVILPQVNTAHTFLVEMPVAYEDVSVESVVRLHEIVQMERPANTSYCLRFLAEARPAELREFLHIGVQSGIGIQHEVIRPLSEEEQLDLAAAGGEPSPPRSSPDREAQDERRRLEEAIAELAPPRRARRPLPKAPRADEAPVEGREVRTSREGGFDHGVQEMRRIETVELEAVGISPEPAPTPASTPAVTSEKPKDEK